MKNKSYTQLIFKIIAAGIITISLTSFIIVKNGTFITYYYNKDYTINKPFSKVANEVKNHVNEEIANISPKCNCHRIDNTILNKIESNEYSRFAQDTLFHLPSIQTFPEEGEIYLVSTYASMIIKGNKDQTRIRLIHIKSLEDVEFRGYYKQDVLNEFEKYFLKRVKKQLKDK